MIILCRFSTSIQKTKFCIPQFDESDDSSMDDTLKEEIKTEINEEKKRKYHNEDIIGNFQEKLKHEKCLFICRELKDEHFGIESDFFIKRTLMPTC